MFCSNRYIQYLFVLMALSTSACQPSPDDLLFIYGRLLSPDGSSVPDQDVELKRLVRAMPPENDDTWSIATQCYRSRSADWADSAPERNLVEAPFLKDATDTSGNFLFETLVAEAQVHERNSLEPACFEIQSDDARSRLRFVHPFTDVHVPGLLLWNAIPQLLEQTAEKLTLDISTPPALPGVGPDEQDAPRQRWVLQSRGDVPFWSTAWSASPRSMDLRILEDFATPVASLQIEAVIPVPSENPFQSRDVSLLASVASKTLPLPPQNRIPISRAGTCAFGAPCPFTDGKPQPVSVVRETSTTSIGVTSVAIALPAPVKPRFIVARNLVLTVFADEGQDTPILVEGTPNGTDWVPMGLQWSHGRSRRQLAWREGEFFAGEIADEAPTVTGIRISVGTLGVILALGELSVFD